MGATAAAEIACDDGAQQPRRRHALPWGLLGMLALVWSVEACCERHAFELDDYMAHVWRFSHEAIAHGAARADVLCFGDSLVKVGVLPGVMEPTLGRSAYNLAVFAGQSPSSYFLLRQVLASGHRPKAVVVDFAPNLLMISPKTTVNYWTRLVNLRDWTELMWHAHSPPLLTRTAATWLLPSFKNRERLRQVVVTNLQGVRWIGLDERRAMERNLVSNRGAMAVSTDTHAVEDLDANANKQRTWNLHSVHARFARKFVDLAASQGIAVFILIPPATPEWQARREQNGVDAPYTKFIASLQAEHPNVFVLDGRHAGYAGPIFSDSTHLNRAGAISLSHGLAQQVAASLESTQPGPRWASLPPYQAWPDDSRVEDISQSRLAIVQQAAARR